MKTTVFLFKIMFFCASMSLANLGYSLSEPYSSLKLLPERPFSAWYANREMIQEIFNTHDIRIALEIGSWVGGGSTRHMGELLKQSKGRLYAIDTWLGNTTQQPGMIHHQSFLPEVFQQFLSNMVHWELTETVVPIRMRSVEAARALDVMPDLIYIDGEHTTEAVYEDLTVWYPFVRDRGILCGDDWTWVTVREAVIQFASENQLQIEASGNFWRLTR